MNYQSVKLNIGERCAYLDLYTHQQTNEKRDSVLIFPGGGYSKICSDREGEPIVLEYFKRGLNAFVLFYNVGDEYVYPSHLEEAQCAMHYLKNNADMLGIYRDRIFALGFSAGGHLAGSLGLLGDDEESRPAGIILCYPVVSAVEKTHEPSFVSLTGKRFSEITIDEKNQLSLELNVKSDSVPAFIWHTASDTVVPMSGSLALAREYYNAGKPVTLHIYPYGDHGVCLGNEVTCNGNPDWIQPLAECWICDSIKWMQSIK